MYKNSRKRNRGISTVIGTVIFVSILLLMVMLVGWMLNEFNNYNTASQKRSEFEWEKENEEISITNIVLNNQTNSFLITIRSGGAVSATIDTNWLLTSDLHKSYSTEVTINPGEVITHNFTQTDVTLNSSKTYTVKVVTKRGNIASIRYPMTMPGGEEGPGDVVYIGPLRFNMLYYSINYTSPDQHTPIPGWVVPSGTTLVWYVELSNTGDSDIKLLEYSVLFALRYEEMHGQASSSCYSFFIVDPDSTYPPDGVYAYDPASDPYILHPNAEGNYHLGGPPVIVKFSSEEIGQTSANEFRNEDMYCLLFIGLYFEYQGTNMGATIPFVAVRAEQS